MKQDKFYITATAQATAALVGFLDDDICECINCLRDSHFYKTMPAEKMASLMQDVYKINFGSKRLYIKLQINQGGNAVVVSFKEDESP